MGKNARATEDADDDRSPKASKGRRGLWICGGILVFLVVATALVNLSLSRRLRISKETTYITEPLKSDGKQVDYFRALQQAAYPPNIATEENGFRLIVQHLGRSPESTPGHFASICKQLGLDVGTIQPDMTYQDPWKFLLAYAESKNLDERLLDALPPDERSRDNLAVMLHDKLEQRWTLDELPVMAKWLEQNSPALDLIGPAVHKPTFHIPMVRHSENTLLFAISLPDLYHMRSFARGLSARANYRIAVGDICGAIDDVIACQRLGRHVGHGATALDLTSGIVIENIGDAIGIAGSLAHLPSGKQLQRLADELDNLPPAADVRNAILSERFQYLDAIQSLAHGSASWEEVFNVPRYITALGVEWNVVARRFNETFDETLTTGSRPCAHDLTLPVAISCLSIHARSKYLADLLPPCGFASWLIHFESGRRSTCAQQVKRITLAMLLYERDHGTLPPAFSVDVAGNPLHSWRVLLLPYLSCETLYERIRLDEPWDSAHNRQFHGEELAIYRCPSSMAAKPGETSYSVVVGPDMPFEAGVGKRLADFGPHSSDMILVVERAEPVGWMDPTRELSQAAVEKVIQWHTSLGMRVGTGMGMDMEMDAETDTDMGMGMDAGVGTPPPPRPAPSGIGSLHHSGTNFGLCSGAVMVLCEEDDSDRLGKMLRGTNAERNDDD